MMEKDGRTAVFETENDVNQLLLELDRGLKTKGGELIESVLRVTSTIEKFPFPIIVNYAFLKLADAFRTGSNMVRFYITQVVDKSEKHLDKVMHMDELMKRFYPVIHSNDPVARAMTLKFLGSIAPIISERQLVHHIVREGLDSHDDVEIDAAILACKRLAAVSRDFAESVCDKLVSVSRDIATSIQFKIKMVPIFEHMHYTLELAAKAREACKSLLARFPSQELTIVVLYTLTNLALAIEVDIIDQIDLLLHSISDDARFPVKYAALKDLLRLARRSPHLWEDKHIQSLIECCFRSQGNQFRVVCLDILFLLSQSGGAIVEFPLEEGTRLRVLYEECFARVNLLNSTKCLKVFSSIATNSEFCKSSDVDDLVSRLMCVTTLIMSDASGSVPNSTLCLQNVLSSFDLLASGHQPKLRPVAVLLIESMKQCKNNDKILLITKMVIKLINSSVISTADILPSVVSCYDGQASWSAAVKVDFVTVMLQCVSGEESVEARFTPMIVQLRDTLDSWSRYRVARQAARFGLHRVARDWTEGLISLTSSEHNYYWLKSLLHCFDAESRLGSGERGCIVEVISQYRQGISCLKCVEQTCADLTTLSFAIRWAELRLRWVLAFQRMFEALSSFHSCPGSILHQRDTDDSSDPLSSFQRFTTLMHRICQLFRNVADGYKKLLKSSFDADCQTVELLRTLQTCLKLVMDAVRRIIHKMEGKKAVEVSDQGQRRLETSKLVHRSQTVQDEIQAWAAQMSANTITAQDVDAVDSIVRKLLFLPVPFPRFFFQKLQVTKIKLNITPQLKSTAEPMSIQHTTLLSLKAEGVIEHAYKKRAFRQINSVVVTLNTQIKQDGLFEYKIPDSVNKQLASEVTPHHDYFCAHFAIQFPVPSLYAVTITIQIRDDELRLWDTDVLASFQVKSFDEAARKQELLAKSTARKSTHAAPPTTQTGKKKD